jgi:predicted TIM-barrel fold metal-dependent hydrolase
MNEHGMIDFRIRPPARDDDDADSFVLAGKMGQYDALYSMEARSNLTFEQLVAEMEAHGVRGIMQAEYEVGRSRDWNLRVADLVGRRPDLFLGGVASVDPREPDALQELEWAHDELGLRGMVIQPGFLELHATDPRCTPLYEFCREREVPVTVHTGVNFSSTGSIEYGRPIHVDQVACAFPGLVLVCNHGGWPWVMESLAVAWKHPTVFLEFGAIAPKYMAHPSGGWHPVTHWMDRQLRSQVLLGTDWPMLRYDRLVEELPLLELRPESHDAYVRSNAQRIIDRVWG